MFRKIEKKAVVQFDLCAVSSVLIGSGNNNELDPRLPDATFLTGSNGTESAYVIPGSTIKGAISSYVYHNIKNLDDKKRDMLFGRAGDGKTIKAQKGKISFHDAYADMATVSTNKRFSTAIDPVLQSAKGGSLNNVQTVDRGTFKAGFTLLNYNAEELLAILYALKSINLGLVRFGRRTSRGYGVMKVNNFEMKVVTGFDKDLNEITDERYKGKGLDECVEEVMRNGEQ